MSKSVYKEIVAQKIIHTTEGTTTKFGAKRLHYQHTVLFVFSDGTGIKLEIWTPYKEFNHCKFIKVWTPIFKGRRLNHAVCCPTNYKHMCRVPKNQMWYPTPATEEEIFAAML